MGNFIEKSVVLVSVILSFSHKKDVIKQIKKNILLQYTVVCTLI